LSSSVESRASRPRSCEAARHRRRGPDPRAAPSSERRATWREVEVRLRASTGSVDAVRDETSREQGRTGDQAPGNDGEGERDEADERRRPVEPELVVHRDAEEGELQEETIRQDRPEREVEQKARCSRSRRGCCGGATERPGPTTSSGRRRRRCRGRSQGRSSSCAGSERGKVSERLERTCRRRDDEVDARREGERTHTPTLVKVTKIQGTIQWIDSRAVHAKPKAPPEKRRAPIADE